MPGVRLDDVHLVIKKPLAGQNIDGKHKIGIVVPYEENAKGLLHEKLVDIPLNLAYGVAG